MKYQTVKCSERKPDKDGIYYTNVGRIQYSPMLNEWTFKDNYGETQQIEVDLWFESISIKALILEYNKWLFEHGYTDSDIIDEFEYSDFELDQSKSTNK